MDAKLVMFTRDGRRKDFSIDRDSTVIGRGENCGLRVPLTDVSRQHCEIIKGEGEIRVRDLASSNGTYVNNRRINETVLNAGDRLKLGPTVFTLQVDGQPEEIAPAETELEALVEADLLEDEQVVDLEADVLAADDSDPISALEALAGEEESEQEEQKPE